MDDSHNKDCNDIGVYAGVSFWGQPISTRRDKHKCSTMGGGFKNHGAVPSGPAKYRLALLPNCHAKAQHGHQKAHHHEERGCSEVLRCMPPFTGTAKVVQARDGALLL